MSIELGSAEEIDALVARGRECALSPKDQVVMAEYLHYYRWMALRLETINREWIKDRE